MSDTTDFVPALGRKSFTWAYDVVIALLTREVAWRGLVLSALKLRPDDIILDVGCGTGTLALMIKRQCPQARVIGLDPDPEALLIARRKAIQAGVTIELIEGRADRVFDVVPVGVPNKVVSSLVFHHLSVTTKRAALKAIFAVLRPGGQLVYCRLRIAARPAHAPTLSSRAASRWLRDHAAECRRSFAWTHDRDRIRRGH